MHRFALLLVSAGCAGCAVIDMQGHTRFDPYPNGFHYIVRVDARYPEASEEAERTRMAWLARYLERHQLCPQGYTTTLRRLIDKPELDEDYLYYVGICN